MTPPVVLCEVDAEMRCTRCSQPAEGVRCHDCGTVVGAEPCECWPLIFVAQGRREVMVCEDCLDNRRNGGCSMCGGSGGGPDDALRCRNCGGSGHERVQHSDED